MNSDVVKKAAAFQRAGKIFMHPYSETTQGFWIFSEPVAVAQAADNRLGAELLAILSKSETRIPHPASWKGLTAPLLKAAGARSFDEFARLARSVDAYLEGGLVTLTPTTNGGPGASFLHANERAIRCRAVDDELTKALTMAFEACD
jgi:hypothetical protein